MRPVIISKSDMQNLNFVANCCYKQYCEIEQSQNFVVRSVFMTAPTSVWKLGDDERK